MKKISIVILALIVGLLFFCGETPASNVEIHKFPIGTQLTLTPEQQVQVGVLTTEFINCMHNQVPVYLSFGFSTGTALNMSAPSCLDEGDIIEEVLFEHKQTLEQVDSFFRELKSAQVNFFNIYRDNAARQLYQQYIDSLKPKPERKIPI